MTRSRSRSPRRSQAPPVEEDSSVRLGEHVEAMKPFGVNIRISPDELLEHASEIKFLLQKFGLIRLEGLQKLDETSMEAFMNQFGDFVSYAGTPADFTADGGDDRGAYVDGYPHIRSLGNGRRKDGKPSSLLADIDYEWHQDSAFVKDAPVKCITFLLCKQAPECGAETLWADSATIFENLTKEQQAEAQAMNVVYSNRFTAGGPAAWDAEFGLTMNEIGTRIVKDATRQRATWKLSEMDAPLVHFCPDTGRNHMCTGAKNMDHIEGLSVEESRDKLDEFLRKGLKPVSLGEKDASGKMLSRTTFDNDVVLVNTWKPGDAILWDNIRFLHSTSPVKAYGSGVREMWQIIATETADEKYKAMLANYYSGGD